MPIAINEPAYCWLFYVELSKRAFISIIAAIFIFILWNLIKLIPFLLLVVKFNKVLAVLIKTPKSSDLKESEVTPENVYLNRRDLLKGLGFLGAGALLANSASANAIDWFSKEEKVKFKTTPLSTKRMQTAIN